MSRDAIHQTVAAYFAALQAQDEEAWLRTLDDSATNYDPVGTPACQGKEALRQMFHKEVTEAFEQIQMRLDSLFIVGSHAAGKWTFQGVRKDGRTILQEGITTFELTPVPLIQTARSYYEQ